MTRHRDPDRRRPGPTPRYWPLDIDLALTVCDLCSGVIPATGKAHEIHTRFHQSGSAAHPPSADPGTNGAPTPPPGDRSRGGAGGRQHDTHRQRAGTSPSDASPPPDPSSPGGSGGASRRTRPAEGTGKVPGGRDDEQTDEDEGDPARYEAGPEPAGWAS